MNLLFGKSVSGFIKGLVIDLCFELLLPVYKIKVQKVGIWSRRQSR